MKIRLILTSLLFLAQIADASAQTSNAPGKTKPSAGKQQPSAIPAQFGVYAREAEKNGVLRCGARIDQHEKFFVQQRNEVGALMFVAPYEANDRLFSMSLEIVENNEPAYVSSTYAPSKKDACSASYDMVKYWPGSCQEVAAKIFPQFSNAGILKKQVTMLGTDPNLRVFLMPAGAGCVSIKKEIVF